MDVAIISKESSVDYISQTGRDIFNLSKIEKIAISWPSYGQTAWYISGEKLYEKPKSHVDIYGNDISLPPPPDEIRNIII